MIQRGSTRDELRADGLTAAVIDASFEVEPGEIFVVMGLSGSGKSTLLRIVNRLLEPTSGSVEIDGQDITGLNRNELRAARRDKISMVFQHFALFPHRTVGQNAGYGLEVKGMSRAERDERVSTALDLAGLSGWGDSYPEDLSGGMKQRVGLARALAADTEILLMDEAFSALDPLIRREMQDQLIDLQHRLGKTILFITHDLNEAMRLGDRIAMMKDGRIVQIGTSEQILKNPANDYVARFVQDVDRSHVLTAAAVMEKPVAMLGAELGPLVAHRLIREHQLNALVVVDRQRKLKGVVLEADVAAAVEAGTETIEGILQTDVITVHENSSLAELFTDSADSPIPLPVLDDEGRLVGVIPRVTLLNALGRSWSDEPGDTAAAANGSIRVVS